MVHITVMCQRQMLNIHWWDHITNAEVLQKTGLPTISEILRSRRLSLFGHVACLDPEVPANKALLLMVNSHDSRGQEAIVKLDQTSGPSSPHLAQPCPGAWRMLMLSHFHLYGELRSSGVMRCVRCVNRSNASV